MRANWLRILTGRALRDSSKLLEGYPPYAIPFSGRPRDLTLDQAQANLNYLVANKSKRFIVLGELLSRFNIDVEEGLKASDSVPVLDSLHEWTRLEFPKLYRPELAIRDVWLVSSREGREIVFSLLMDLALFLAEIVILRRKAYTWSLDLDPANDADGMITFKRPVVQIPKGGPFPAPIMFDFESIVFGHYHDVPSPMFGRFNELARPVLDALSGAHERHWLEQAALRESVSSSSKSEDR